MQWRGKEIQTGGTSQGLTVRRLCAGDPVEVGVTMFISSVSSISEVNMVELFNIKVYKVF